MSLNRSKIEETFKSKDTEEFLDKLFYRPLGYRLAVFARSANITPNVITITSIFFGVLAGHLFFYQNTVINLIGVILLITAETMDSADGQLARMTNFRSRYGRILDGVAGNIMNISIYLHLCARFVVEGGSLWIFLFAIVSGISHSYQSAMSDYYRNYYLFFVYGENKSEIDSLKAMREKYKTLSWTKDLAKKFLLRVYVNYLFQQESLSKNLRELFSYAVKLFDGNMPDWVREEYRRVNKPLLKYGNILTTNTRMSVLFLTIFFGNIFHYFLFEFVGLNLLLIYAVMKQEQVSKYLLTFIKTKVENK